MPGLIIRLRIGNDRKQRRTVLLHHSLEQLLCFGLHNFNNHSLFRPGLEKVTVYFEFVLDSCDILLHVDSRVDQIFGGKM